MCGIYGILALDGNRRHDPAVLGRMGDAMVHRGHHGQAVAAQEPIQSNLFPSVHGPPDV